MVQNVVRDAGVTTKPSFIDTNSSEVPDSRIPPIPQTTHSRPEPQTTLPHLRTQTESTPSFTASPLSSAISQLLSDLSNLPDELRRELPGSYLFVDSVRTSKEGYDSAKRKLEALQQTIWDIARERQDLLTRLLAERANAEALFSLLDIAQLALAAAEYELKKQNAEQEANEVEWKAEREWLEKQRDYGKDMVSKLHTVAENLKHSLDSEQQSLREEREKLMVVEKELAQARLAVNKLEESLAVAESEKKAAQMSAENEKQRVMILEGRYLGEKAEWENTKRSLKTRMRTLERELSAFKKEEAERLRREAIREAVKREAERRKQEELRREEERKRQEERERREREEREREEKRQREQAEQERRAREERTESIKASWTTYGQFWATNRLPLNVTFASIRWPILEQPKTPQDLELHKIQEFILSPHHSKERTDRQRVKDALLRWHPDKFRRVLENVTSGEKDRVRDGADIVAKHLNTILETL